MNVYGERLEEGGVGIDSCTYCMILIFCCATGRNFKWQVLKIVSVKYLTQLNFQFSSADLSNGLEL
jgi:hypothetical protein